MLLACAYTRTSRSASSAPGPLLRSHMSRYSWLYRSPSSSGYGFHAEGSSIPDGATASSSDTRNNV
eukprot:345289-Chlamydomonas_euryale.AAC.1